MSLISTGLITATKTALPLLLLIFVVVFCAIILTRIILNYLFNRAYQDLAKNLKKGKKLIINAKNKKYIKEDEELIKKKIAELPRAHSEVKAEMKAGRKSAVGGSYEVIASEEKERDRKELNEINIVDIVKPVGFWTSMILGQKLTYLINSAQMINKRGDKGFWASMIEAKERAAGKQHSRGR
jgi:hypothetical protein